MLKIYSNEEVWGFPFCGLGDSWSIVSYLLKLPIEIITCSRWCGTGNDLVDIIPLITSLLDTSKTFNIVDVKTKTFPNLLDCYKSNYCSSKEKWVGSNSNMICYQFDGLSDSKRKNLLPQDEIRLLKFLLDLGYTTVNIGGHKPLSQVIHTMANSAAFIGVPSGMSHVASSIIGLPNIIILTDKMLNCFDYFIKHVYGNKPNTMFYHGADSFLHHKSFLHDFEFNRRKLISHILL